jgi:hypothetical protein
LKSSSGKLSKLKALRYSIPPGGYITDKPVTVKGFKDNYDLALYAFDFPTASNNTVIRISGKGGLGGANNPGSPRRSRPWRSALPTPTTA